MKRIVCCILCVICFAGCGHARTDMEQILSFRQSLLNAGGCSFDVEICADYGQKTYTFAMQCTAESSGAMKFQVAQPEVIAGITGVVAEDGGRLTFDDKVLLFELLADGQISPVCAPWLFVRAVRGGYLKACGKDGANTRVRIDDSYLGKVLIAELWTNADGMPIRCELLYDGRRIVSMNIGNFRIL